MGQQLNPDRPLVSVITPFYNGAEWLRQAIKGVIDQSYTNWELILVDDGSSNEASAIAKLFSEQYPGKIVYVEHEGHQNKGVTASRNLGIAHSNGELIAFLDSDDYWLPGKLENQVRLMSAHSEVSMLCEASLYWSDWENPLATNIMVYVGADQNKIYKPPHLIYTLYPLGKGAAPCPSGIIVTRESLLKLKGFEESFVGANQVYEDQAFLCKYYLNEKVYISDLGNNYYRQRSGSLMESITKKQQYARVRKYFLEWLEKYLHNNSIHDKKINRLIRLSKTEINHPVLYKIMKKLMSLF